MADGPHTVTAAGGATQVTSDGIYTADVTGSGTATDGGNYGGGVAGNMFDGNMSSKFSFASSILPNWWKYDFGSGNSETVNRLVIYGADTNNQTMTDWTFSGSNNDSDWTLLDTQSLGGAGSWPSNTTKTFSFTNTTAYRYYKMDITANTGGTVWLEIRDVQMLELTTAVSPKYGTAMGKFEGTESANWDCVTVPDHADWRLGADGDGTGVFTIECWHYKTQTGTTDTMFAHGNDANDYWTFLTTGTALIFKKTVSSSETTIKSENTNGGSNIAINQWYHFKLTRDSSDNLHMYLNGIELGSGTSHADAIPDFSGTLAIGAQDRNGTIQTGLNGFLDDVRISNSDRGSGQPSAKLTTDANTKLLLNMDGTTTTFVDSSFAAFGPSYAFVWGPAGMTSYNDADTVVSVWTGSAWKQAINYTGSIWQYNTNTLTDSTVTWAPATVNDMNHALSQAVLANATLKMTETDIEAITSANFAATNGPMASGANTTQYGVATVIKSTNNTQSLGIDLVRTNTTASSVWKPVAQYDADGTQWQYNDDTANTNATNWRNASTNDIAHAISEAIDVPSSAVGMTAATLTGITSAQYGISGGPVFGGTTRKLGIGSTLKSTTNTENPVIDTIAKTYDQQAQAIDLRTKQWTGSGGTPAAPGSAPGTIYLFIVDEQTSGTPTYSVSRDGGTTWTTVTFDASWTFSGSKVARRAAVDVTGQPSGTDPRMRITNAQGDNFKIHAIGLQTRT